MPAQRTPSRAHLSESSAIPAPGADEIELLEMANLTSKDTGVDGIIYISTAQGNHAPHVKWYPGRPSARAPSLSVTVEVEPDAFNHNLPDPVASAAADAVKRWVVANRIELLNFWNEGASWTRDEVNDFIDGLKKLP